ncbi:MAG: hypothetical protein IV090_08740 [Candidatus Sericytochromatia bacterium]|nr:hypothetical protein [Candidatus Sericytochromatia bacterium]
MNRIHVTVICLGFTACQPVLPNPTFSPNPSPVFSAPSAQHSQTPSGQPSPSPFPFATDSPAFSANGIGVTPLAGKQIWGYKDGPALEAQFGDAIGKLCQDSKGNIYIPDRTYLRKLSPDGQVTTVAGGATMGFQNGAAKDARFSFISACVIDREDNLYLTDATNFCIRKLNRSDQVSTLAGRCSQYGESDGEPNTARFQAVRDLIIDENKGNLIVIEEGRILLRKINLNSGYVQTLYDRRNALGQDTVGFADGSLENKGIFGSSLLGITFDPESTNYYVGDFDENHAIRQIKDSSVSTLAGKGASQTRPSEYIDGQGKNADFARMYDLAFDSNRKLIFVADGSSIRTVTLDGKVRTLNLPEQSGYQNPLFNSIHSLFLQNSNTLIVVDNSNKTKGKAVFYRISLPDGPLPEILTREPY